MYKKNVLLLPLAVCLFISVQAQQVISDLSQAGSLEIVSAANTAIICTDAADLDLVQRVISFSVIEKTDGQKCKNL